MKHGQFIVLDNGYYELIRGRLLSNLNELQVAKDKFKSRTSGMDEYLVKRLESIGRELDLLISTDLSNDMPQYVYDAAITIAEFANWKNFS